MPVTASIDNGHELARTAAAALGRLRRSPSARRRDGWVGSAMRVLEEDHPATFARLRRRTGFVLQLGDFARLKPAERAAITLGLLFRELSEDPSLVRGTPPRAWEDYLLRHDDWLAPCFAIAQHLDTDEWGTEDESLPAVVARIACYYDDATLEEHRRPLQVLEELPVRVQTPAEEAVASLLLSEDGQELCDHHFRRQAEGYQSPAVEIARSIMLLRKETPRPAAMRAARAADDEAPVAPFRVSGSAGRPKERRAAPKAEASPPAAKPRAERSDNFERRREALRSLSASGRSASAARATAEAVEDDRHEVVPPPRREDREPASAARALEEPVIGQEADGEEPAAVDYEDAWREPEPARYIDRYTPIEGVPPEEDDMDNIRSISAARGERPSQADVIARLEEIQLQFERIQRVAEEGQRMLASLAPQLHELTGWMSELETIMERWRGPRGSADERVA